MLNIVINVLSTNIVLFFPKLIGKTPIVSEQDDLFANGAIL